MILLDTNVVSEVMRPSPSGLVLGWLNEMPTADLFISSISIAEICYGLQSLPEGQRRDNLVSRFEQFVEQGFSQRILDFDANAARAYGEVMASRRHMGKTMSALDGQIAAIASIHYAKLATRNVGDFEHCDIEISIHGITRAVSCDISQVTSLSKFKQIPTFRYKADDPKTGISLSRFTLQQWQCLNGK